MHDTNDQAFVHMDDASYSTNIDVSTAMIIYALYVDGAIGFEYNADISSGDATVSTSIHKGR
jgi:hypothetical protein